MSIIHNAKAFFGLTPYEDENEDYEAGARYETAGSAAYQPRAYEGYGEAGYGHREETSEPRRYATPASPAPEIVRVQLHSYRDARQVGDPFRAGDAVIIDMDTMTTSEAKRVIDFAAGLCFALRGQMKKLDNRVFALIPREASFGISELERAARLR